MRCARAYVLASAGDHPAATTALNDLAPSRFGVLVENSDWLTSMALLARTCELTGDDRHAELLYHLLRPYADRVVVVALALTSFGPVACELGGLACLTGRGDDARAHFEHALAIASGGRSAPWTARIRCAYARGLRQTDSGAAEQLARDSAGTARNLGMAGVAAAAEALA